MPLPLTLVRLPGGSTGGLPNTWISCEGLLSSSSRGVVPRSGAERLHAPTAIQEEPFVSFIQLLGGPLAGARLLAKDKPRHQESPVGEHDCERYG